MFLLNTVNITEKKTAFLQIFERNFIINSDGNCDSV